MLWKKIKKIPYKNVGSCIKEVRKKSIISPWIEDIFSKKKKLILLVTIILKYID